MELLKLDEFDTMAYVDECMLKEVNGENFPVDFDIAWQIAGYVNKASAKRALPHRYKNEFYIINKVSAATKSREDIKLTCDGLKHLCMMANTKQGHEIRMYFIEAEKQFRLHYLKNQSAKTAKNIEAYSEPLSVKLPKLNLEQLKLYSVHANKSFEECSKEYQQSVALKQLVDAEINRRIKMLKDYFS